VTGGGGPCQAGGGAGAPPRWVAVAITSDHNTRGFFRYPSVVDLPLRDGVPLLLEVPAPYLAGRTPDLARWGGHRDVIPTLQALVLGTREDLSPHRRGPRGRSPGTTPC